MPELDAKDRDDLRSNQFAYVDKDGGEHLPLNDASHVRNASPSRCVRPESRSG